MTSGKWKVRNEESIIRMMRWVYGKIKDILREKGGKEEKILTKRIFFIRRK